MFVKTSNDLIINTDRICYISIDKDDEDDYAEIAFGDDTIYLNKKQLGRLESFLSPKVL